MAKDDKKSKDDWLPVAQGVGPPDPAPSLAQTGEVQQSKVVEGAPETPVQCTPRTAENWDLGGNN